MLFVGFNIVLEMMCCGFEWWCEIWCKVEVNVIYIGFGFFMYDNVDWKLVSFKE